MGAVNHDAMDGRCGACGGEMDVDVSIVNDGWDTLMHGAKPQQRARAYCMDCGWTPESRLKNAPPHVRMEAALAKNRREYETDAGEAARAEVR